MIILKVLLVEDDVNLCKSLSFQLRKENFIVDICNDGEDGLFLINEDCYDLIILDRMLPSIDGISILSKIREKGINTPVILLTALGEVKDRITGLDCGADDYIVKPFDFNELLARIRCVTRRPRKIETFNKLTYKDITYDVNERILTSHSKSCSLSKREGDVLSLFIKNPEVTISRDKLLSLIWGSLSEVEDGNIDNYIYFIRRRLKAVESVLNIKTVRGLGYKLVVNNA